MIRLARQSVVMLVALSVVTGIVYPLVVTGIAQAVFGHQANGSVIVKDGRAVGSELVGQAFSQPKYFWSRLPGSSALAYDAANSGGTNLGPLNPALAENVKKRVEALRAADPSARGPVPVDLVTASGSGLDGDMSPAAAEFQVARVAAARGWTPAKVRALVARHTAGRQLGLLGQPRVNVLLLNLALDEAGQ
ncbi:MAG: potassium-transporting ATPase subunit KdpC [Planctomycetota bacterium]|nr:potassium-transporting ATPase subunit KdpC [Planctomycetota bacterium]